MMAIAGKHRLRTLAGACALLGAVVANAAPATVHYEVFSTQGALQATGDAYGGNSWLNNTDITASVHRTNYLVHFFIDPVANTQSITWTFDWKLAYGGSISSSNATVLKSLSVTESVAIGSAYSGWTSVGGDSLAADSLTFAPNLGTVRTFMGTTPGKAITAAQPYSLGSAASAANQQIGQSIWYGGSSATEAWAYVSSVASYAGMGNLTASISNYGNVLASAEVTVAQPVFPDNFPTGDGTGGGQAPEPASLGLLAAGGLLAGWRRRRDRLKRLPA